MQNINKCAAIYNNQHGITIIMGIHNKRYYWEDKRILKFLSLNHGLDDQDIVILYLFAWSSKIQRGDMSPLTPPIWVPMMIVKIIVIEFY